MKIRQYNKPKYPKIPGLELNNMSVHGLHCGEEKHVADRAAAGEEHDAAVNAHAHASGGGHAVLKSQQEILIQHLGLVVAALTLLHLLFKAITLVDGVVKLGVGIGQLAVADEKLKALGKAGICGRALGERRNLNRVHGDEGGLDQFFFHTLVEAGVKGVAPGLLRSVCQLNADGPGSSNCLCIIGDGGKVNANILTDSINHTKPAPAGAQVNVLALPFHLIAAQDLLSCAGDDALGNDHHVVEIGIGLVELHGGELGVVLGVHA